MEKKEYLITYAGLTKLEFELDQLKTVRRKEISERIKVARDYGDLSENSEYDEAKNEQGLVESRIVELEAMLKRVRVLDENEITTEHVMVGSRVKVLDNDGEKETYDIVGSAEAEPLAKKISDESPVGKAMMGHGVNDKVEVKLPTGAIAYFTILEILNQNSNKTSENKTSLD